MQNVLIRHRALRGQINPINGQTVVDSELGAQFNLHQRPKEKITIPASMSWYLIMMGHVELRTLS